METGYGVIIKDNLEISFIKDKEVVNVATSIEEFIVVRNLIKDAYTRAEQNNRIHGLEINPTLEKLRELYESTFNALLEAEGGRVHE